MDAPNAIDALVRRLPPADVAHLLAARGLPSVVHGPSASAAAGALAAALQDELIDWEWEADDGDEADLRDGGRYHDVVEATGGALVAVGNRVVFVGGMDASRREITHMYVWDLAPGADGGFKRVRSRGDASPPLHTAGMFAVAYEGEVWVFPGPGNPDPRRVSVFDPDADRWRHLTASGPAPASADGFIRRTVVGVVDARKGRMWAVGGGCPDAWSFDFETTTWTRRPVAAPPAPAFTFGGAAFHNGQVWIYGSTDPDDPDAPVGVWSLDPRTISRDAAGRHAWRPVRPPPSPFPPPPFRLHAASAVVGDRWIVHGGRRPGPFNVVADAWEFCFTTGAWSPVLSCGPPAPAREWHAGVGLADCAVFVGGRTDIPLHDTSPDHLSSWVDLLWTRAPRPRPAPTGSAALLASLAAPDRPSADVALVASDGVRVPAVRAALAAASPVFATMLGAGGRDDGARWAEGRPGGEVAVADVDGRTLRALVAYCHGGLAALPATLAALLALFEAADKYDMAGLVKETVAGARARARPDDVGPLLAAAQRRTWGSQMAGVCEEVAAGCLTAVLAAPSFEALCRAEPDVGLAFVRRVVERLGVPGSGGAKRGAAVDDDADANAASCRAPASSSSPTASEEDEDDESEYETEVEEGEGEEAAAPAAVPGTPARAPARAGAADPPTPDALLAEE